MNEILQNLINFNINEIKILENEATISVIHYLQNRYQTFWTFKPNNNFIKRLYEPFYDQNDNDVEITELDGVIILSNDIDDFNNEKLNVQFGINKTLNKQYEESLKNNIAIYNARIHSEYNKILNTKTFDSSQIKKLEKKRTQLSSQLFRYSLKPEKNVATEKTRIFVIVETKHKVTSHDVKNKLAQMKRIKEFFIQTKKFYKFAKDYLDCKTLLSTSKAQKRRMQRNNLDTTDINQQIQSIMKTANNLYSELLIKCNDENWTDKFVNLLEYESLNFDDVMLFIGGSLWEDEKLKLNVINNGYNIIELSGYRYNVVSAENV